MDVREVAGEQDLDRRRRLVARQPEVELPLPLLAVGRVDAADREMPEVHLPAVLHPPALDAERDHEDRVDLAVRPDLHAPRLFRRILADGVDAGGDVEDAGLLDRRAFRFGLTAPGVGAPGPDRLQGTGVHLRAVAEVLPLLGHAGGDGELALQMPVAQRLEGEGALAVVRQEQPGDGAEEVPKLPLVVKLLVLRLPLAEGHGPDRQDRYEAEEKSSMQFRFHRMSTL